MKTRPTSLITHASVLAVPVLTAALALVAFASTASAQEPAIECGTVVTADVRLEADLIDLAGHLIDGTGTGIGIDNSAGHDQVRITGGTVREFLFGVHLFETSGGRIDRLAVASNVNGVALQRSNRVELDRVTALDNAANGIEINFSDRVGVRRSTAAGNGLVGIFDVASTGSTYVHNLVEGNAGPGLMLWFSDGSVVERNDARANDSDGIQITGPGNTLARNHATGNGGLGIAADAGTVDGGRNRASGNLGGGCTGVVCR
jgi:hypothetical protein